MGPLLAEAYPDLECPLDAGYPGMGPAAGGGYAIPCPPLDAGYPAGRPLSISARMGEPFTRAGP
jgi:hypothetical protein